MKKIIAAFDGLRFSQNTLDQAIALSKQHQAHLVGIFLQEKYRLVYSIAERAFTASSEGQAMVRELVKQDTADGKESVLRFQGACAAARVEYSIHSDKGTALKELLHESLFADLLVIDAEETFSSLDENLPGGFIRSFLHATYCPVWLAGKRQVGDPSPVFLYDGRPASIHAMKAFTCLLPEMEGKEAEILTIKPDRLNSHLPDYKLLKEWAKRHYKKVTYHSIEGDTSALSAYLKEHSDRVLVTGAYGRSKLSVFFYPSLADELIRRVKLPVFVAHR